MRIAVTKQDIKMGQKGIGFSCPVALALNRKTTQDWTVGFSFAYSKKKVLKLSENTRKFIHDFDSGKPVKPFSFTVKYNK